MIITKGNSGNQMGNKLLSNSNQNVVAQLIPRWSAPGTQNKWTTYWMESQWMKIKALNRILISIFTFAFLTFFLWKWYFNGVWGIQKCCLLPPTDNCYYCFLWRLCLAPLDQPCLPLIPSISLSQAHETTPHNHSLSLCSQRLFSSPSENSVIWKEYRSKFKSQVSSPLAL